MSMKTRVLLSLIVVFTNLWMAGCGHYTCGVTFGGSCSSSGGSGVGSTGSGQEGTPAAFAYYVNSGTIGTILDTSGNFGLIPNYTPPSYTLSGGYANMAIVQKKWIYEPGSLAVESYSIAKGTGYLSVISGQPFASPDDYKIFSDPAGKFLFVTGANNDEVTVFGIDQTTGFLTTVGSYPTGIGFAAQAATDGLGKFLYVTAGNLGSQVAVFSIGSNGALTSVGVLNISVAELKSEPTGKFMLGVTGNGANNGVGTDPHIYVYSVNQSTGLLTPVSGSPFVTTYIPGNLAVHPSGNLVYAFNYTVLGPSPMEGFQLNTTTGALTEVANSPFTSLTPYDGAFDQSGSFLFLHSIGSIAVSSVSTSTGALTSVGSSLSNTGDVAWGVTDPQ